MLYMKQANWEMPDKPYDLRKRLLIYACLIVRVVHFLHTRGSIARALSYQILKSGTSAGANYEEADDGSSPRDTLAKRRITLRELKETRFRLMVVRECGFLTSAHDPVLNETSELIKIVAKIIRNSS
jgi:four helix bundle protein